MIRTILGSILLVAFLFVPPVLSQSSLPLSQLPAGSSVNSSDLFYDVQTPGVGGVKVTAQQIGNYIFGKVSGSCVAAGTGVFSCSESAGAVTSILDFGADPTGAADSTSAIQAAIDSLNGTSKRVVLCPDGIYKTTRPIFLDPPGNLRGADGTNGQAWSSGGTYAKFETVNSAGIAYINLTGSNTSTAPASDTTNWRAFAWNSGTTYAANAVVSFNGVPWISLVGSNLNHTPAAESAFWRPAYVFIGPNQNYNFGYTFTGNPGMGAPNSGCTIEPQYDNGVFFWSGPGNGMMVQNVSIQGSNPNNYYRGQYPAVGIGLCVANGSGGANRTRLENLYIGQINTLFETGCNVVNADGSAGQGALGAETNFRRVFGANCANFVIISGTQNDINDVDESSDQCTNQFVAVQGPGIHVSNSNVSTPSGATHAFPISSVSAVTTSNLGNGTTRYNFSATLTLPGGSGICAAGDAGACLTCPDAPTVGNCVYNAWVVLTPHFGLVPVSITGWNSSTKVATFQTLLSWSNSLIGPQVDATATTDFSTEIQAATTIYANEMATTFNGIGIQADHLHIENNVCTRFFFDETGFSSERGNIFTHVRFNYVVSFYVDSNPSNGSYPTFLCQESWPFIDTVNGAGSTNFQFDAASWGDHNVPGGINFDIDPSKRCKFGLQENDQNALWSPSIRAQRTSGDSLYQWANIQGACEFDTTPFWPNANTYGMVKGIPTVGWFPATYVHPRVQSPQYAQWKALGGANPNSYPPVSGNTIYESGTSNPGDADIAPSTIFQSTHLSYSYGQNLTTSNVSGLSWAYKGQSCVVLADSNTLNYVFPGLGITLDNGGGAVHYVVTGVYPQATLDGGTHAGYFTIASQQIANASPCGVGTKTTVYTGTTIGQDSYVFKTLTLQ